MKINFIAPGKKVDGGLSPHVPSWNMLGIETTIQLNIFEQPFPNILSKLELTYNFKPPHTVFQTKDFNSEIQGRTDDFQTIFYLILKPDPGTRLTTQVFSAHNITSLKKYATHFKIVKLEQLNGNDVPDTGRKLNL